MSGSTDSVSSFHASTSPLDANAAPIPLVQPNLLDLDTRLPNRSSFEIDKPAFESPELLTSGYTSGWFTVGSTGQVSIDYLYDGGSYEGDVGIFSLEGLDELVPGSTEFIQTVVQRVLSNSTLGHLIISDRNEGARFDSNFNAGDYLGVKTFGMNAGDRFGMVLVPNGTFYELAQNPALDGSQRPLFSLSLANPIASFQFGQIADVTGNGSTFVFEDLRVDGISDRDYEDIVLQIRGAIGFAAELDKVISPSNDWRNSTIGQSVLNYIAPYDTPVSFPSCDYQFPNSNQPLIGIIDTGFAANNPDIDYSRIILGRDYVDGDANPLLAPGEGNEHGTHILGIIGATQNNGIGIDGVNDQAPIWLGRAIGSGKWAESLVEFVNQALETNQPNAVVNLSLDLTQRNPDGSITTRYEFTPEERAALEYARQSGVLIVAAAGNDGGVMSALGQASQEFDNVITVGSVDYSGRRAAYSNFGSGLDIVAYGGTFDTPVLSTVGNGDDLRFLIGQLDALGGEVAGFVQSILDTLPTEFSDIDVMNSSLPDELTSLSEQAYEEAWDEVSAVFADNADLSDADLSDDEKELLQSQVDLEDLLGEFDSFLGALPPDFLDILNDPEVADLLALLNEPDITTEEDLDLGIGEMAGTSVATATVTGAISQIWAANPQLSYTQVKDILKRTAVDLGDPGWDAETGAGLVNLAAAISLAKQTSPQKYEPEAFATPTTWSGQGTVTPTERAATEEFLGKYYEWDTYTIRSRDTLSAIAQRTMGNGSAPYYNFIASKNNIPNPNLIYAGRTILIPRQVPAPQPQPQPQPQPGYSVQGGIRQRWLQNPWLGEPRSNEIGQGNGVVIQYFANGYIIWNGRRATAYRTGGVNASRVSPTPKSRSTSNGSSINRAYSSIAVAREALLRTLATTRSNMSSLRSLLGNSMMQASRLANFKYLRKVQSYAPTGGIDFAADLFTGNYLFGPTVCGVAPNRDFNQVKRIPHSSWNPVWNQQQAACAVHDYEINKTGKDPMRDWTDPGIIKAHARLAATSPYEPMRNGFAILATVGALGYGTKKLHQKSQEVYAGFNRWGASFAKGIVQWAYPRYPF